MPRKENSPDIPQDREQLLKELGTLRAKVHSIEETLGSMSAPASGPNPTTSIPHPQAYPLGDPAFPYQRMVEELSEGLVALSPTHAIRYLNRRFATLIGVPAEQLLDGDFFELVASEDKLRFETFLSAPIQEHIELHLIGAHRRLLPVEISTREWIVNGIRTFLVVMDLSERQQAQELLAFQALLLEHVNEAVIAIDTQFRITHWNGGAERMYGWTAEEAIGRSMPELVRSSASDAERAQVVEHLRRFDSSMGEVTHYRKDGEPLRIEWNTHPLRDAAGVLTGYVSITRDITARRRTQEALQDSEQFFARVFQLSPTAIAISRLADGRILDVNDRFLRFTGYRRDQVIGRSTVELGLWVEPAGRPDFNPTPKAPGVHHFEARLQTQTGEVRNVRVSADLIGRQGEDVILALIDDITDRKRFEERALRHAEQLRRYATDMQRYSKEAQRRAEERQQHATRLERLVRVRTAELEAANEELKKEIAARQEEILTRKRTEAKLRDVMQSLEDTMLAARESEQLLRIAIEAAGMVAWMYDPAKDEVITFARTPDWLQILTDDRFPLTGRGLELVHPNDRDKITEALPRAMNGEPFNIAVRLLLPDGGVRWIATQGRLMAEISGKPPLLVGVMQDITERRRVQEEIKALARFPAENPNPVLRLDPQGVILYANDASASVLKGWDVSVGGVVPESLRVMVARAFETQQGCVVDVELESQVYSFNIAPVPEAGYVNIYGRDITDRKRAESEVQQLNRDLERRATELAVTNQELESFSYSVSHDLRAPLSFVDVITTTLQQDYGAHLPEQVQHYLNLIRANTKQMDKLITSLLSLSRLSRHALKREEVNMTAVVREALETLQKEVERADLTIEVLYLSAATADPVLIKQVWVNLIANAVKFTRNRESARIEIGSEPGDGEERVYFVRDNGVGFDMEQADRLFGVFQRLHAEEEYEGSGVGLAIVQRIVHMHGGRVWAEAEIGKGAVFYFTLGFGDPPNPPS